MVRGYGRGRAGEEFFSGLSAHVLESATRRWKRVDQGGRLALLRPPIVHDRKVDVNLVGTDTALDTSAERRGVGYGV